MKPTRSIRRPGVALAAVALATSPSTAQRVVDNPPAEYRHKGTDTAFPPAIGEFRRTNIREYSADGRDASVGYDLIRDERKLATVTMYIYPAPPVPAGTDRASICRATFEGTKEAITQGNPSATLTSEAAASPPMTSVTAEGHRASYTLTTRFDGRDTDVATDAWLFCPKGSDWLVKYRATRLLDPDVTEAIRDFQARLPWSPAVGG